MIEYEDSHGFMDLSRTGIIDKKQFRLDDEHDESWSDFDEDNCCFPVVLSVGSRVYRVSDATFYL